MSTNDFVPFCPTDTGTNLLSQSAYLVDPQLSIGNQPGVARSKLDNKAVRQGTTVAAAIAQYITNQSSTSLTDDNTPAKLLNQFTAALMPIPPMLTYLTSGTGNYGLIYQFFIEQPTINPTAGATYTNNGVTFTVKATVTGLTLVAQATSAFGFPNPNGVLTKATGTGDATITFDAVRFPQYVNVKLVGGGGGGAGGGTGSPGNGTDGTDTTFGTLTGGGGKQGGTGAAPGVGSGGDININGQYATLSTLTNTSIWIGGEGGSSFLGLGGAGGAGNSPGLAAAGYGAGGQGGGTSGGSPANGAYGGGGGGYCEKTFFAPLASYAYTVGTNGTGGAAGTSGAAASSGTAGIIIIAAYY